MTSIDLKEITSQTTRRLLENDPTLDEVRIASIDNNIRGFAGDEIAYLTPKNKFGFKMVGENIGNNTTVSKLVICSIEQERMETFMNGAKRNNNIHTLVFVGWHAHNGAVFPPLSPWLENNCNLTTLQIVRCPLGSNGIKLLASTLATNNSLEHISIRMCSVIDDEAFDELVNVLNNINAKHLIRLDLNDNNIGTRGCAILATTLSNKKSDTLKNLNISHNDVNDEGITHLAKALTQNNRLKELNLNGNAITENGWRSLATALCNSESISDIYLSNHSLQSIGISSDRWFKRNNADIVLYLSINSGGDNSVNEIDPFVPIQKILHHNHEWDISMYIGEELELLPYILSWIERAGILNTNYSGITNSKKREYRRRLQSIKHKTIHEFVKAFPVVVVDKLHSTLES